MSSPPASGSDGGSSKRPPKEDPWEARERMLARYRKGGSSSSSSHSSHSSGSSHRSSDSAPEKDDFGPIKPEEAGLANNINIVGLLAAVAMLMVAEVPSVDGKLRKLMAQAGTAVLLLLIALTRRWRPSSGTLLSQLKRAPWIPLIALLGWTAFEFFQAPYRDFAAVELLRVLAGGAACVLGAWSLRTPRQTAWTTAALIGIGVGISLWDFGRNGQADMRLRGAIDTGYSVFGTHEDVASLLVLLLPISLSFALTPAVEEKRRLSALAATLILGAALLVSRTRTSWVGGFVAIIVLAVLMVWSQNSAGTDSDRRRGRSPIAAMLFSPITLLLAGLLVFTLAGGMAAIIGDRALSMTRLSKDSSLRTRLNSWEGAARMTAEAPVTGRGLGTFPVIQGQWTHQGAEVQTVLNDRYGHESIAHDYYVQWAADTGTIGLILYITTVVSALLSAVYAIPRVTAPFARALLLGGTAAIAGGVVDALASPAYNFFGVSTVFWLCIGLTITAAGLPSGRRSGTGKESVSETPWWVWGGGLAVGVAAAGVVLFVGHSMKAAGEHRQRGMLTVTLAPSGRLVSGDIIQWTAKYVDENGEEIPTMPGTVWEVSGAPSYAHLRAALTGVPAGGQDDFYHNRSTLSLVAPGGAQPLVAHARFCDRYGRWYDAWSMAQVAPAPLPILKKKAGAVPAHTAP